MNERRMMYIGAEEGVSPAVAAAAAATTADFAPWPSPLPPPTGWQVVVGVLQ